MDDDPEAVDKYGAIRDDCNARKKKYAVDVETFTNRAATLKAKANEIYIGRIMGRFLQKPTLEDFEILLKAGAIKTITLEEQGVRLERGYLNEYKVGLTEYPDVDTTKSVFVHFHFKTLAGSRALLRPDAGHFKNEDEHLIRDAYRGIIQREILRPIVHSVQKFKPGAST